VFFSIVLINFLTAPRIKNIAQNLNEKPLVSILVPARNEEKNIGKLLESLTQQSYKNYEIIILDDNSTDKTYDVAAEFAKSNSKIKAIKGKELPKGWLGKNWACLQLSDLANGKMLLFVDADVQLNQHVLSYTLWIIKTFDLGMLSVFPSQKITSFGELLTVPLMNWLLLTFLPLKSVYDSNSVSFTAANGQFILIKKDVYINIGTHSTFKNKVVEDMEIARAVKDRKEKIITCVGNNNVTTEMYNDFNSAFNGFSKNFFPAFNISRITFIILISIFALLFLFPLFLIFWNSIFLLVFTIILFERFIVSVISKENPFYNIFLHPVQMIIMYLIGINSVSKKKKVWKGRII
jgi:chlorobactene glucosyltransferase